MLIQEFAADPAEHHYEQSPFSPRDSQGEETSEGVSVKYACMRAWRACRAVSFGEPIH